MARLLGARRWWEDEETGRRILLIYWRGVIYAARGVDPKGEK
jgi:hypothetical protein